MFRQVIFYICLCHSLQQFPKTMSEPSVFFSRADNHVISRLRQCLNIYDYTCKYSTRGRWMGGNINQQNKPGASGVSQFTFFA